MAAAPLLFGGCANEGATDQLNVAVPTASPIVAAPAPAPVVAAQAASPAASPAQPMIEQKKKAPERALAVPTAAQAQVAEAPPSVAAPPAAPDGWIDAYVTSSISTFDPQGKLAARVSRDAVPLPAGGLPYTQISKSQLVKVSVNGQEVRLDPSEFEVRSATKLVDETCSDRAARGQSAVRQSAGSMGHGHC